MDFARSVWGIPDSGYRRRAMYRNIPLGFSDTLVGGTPSPGQPAFTGLANTPYGVAFSLPLVAVPAHPRRKDGGCRRRSKSFSWCGFCMGIDIFSFAAYNNSTRQATACVCQSVEVRECAGRHCLTELARGVVQ
jgi:hypothetical protein